MRRFSALQRAENSSIIPLNEFEAEAIAVSVLFSEPKIPQSKTSDISGSFSQVSVLFSEPKIPQCCQLPARRQIRAVSVLFSEPKIPQSSPAQPKRRSPSVSVLFSEPKIPQLALCLVVFDERCKFQCSSASRKFLNCYVHIGYNAGVFVSVLFSEPKIPQSTRAPGCQVRKFGFSALQRAENSSIV